MLSNLRNFDVLDDMFNDPFFKRTKTDLMKTDILEKNGNYILDMDLPGCKKENIEIELKDEYLHISATINNSTDTSDEDKNYIHKERFYGNCSRSFYVGKNVNEDDIKASFKDGILHVEFPKKDETTESKKYISID